MKNYLLLLFSICFLTSCAEKGALQKVSDENNEIEVYRYYYSSGSFVYVSKFKDQKNISTTTWAEGRKTSHNITIFENDSIKVVLK